MATNPPKTFRPNTQIREVFERFVNDIGGDETRIMESLMLHYTQLTESERVYITRARNTWVEGGGIVAVDIVVSRPSPGTQPPAPTKKRREPYGPPGSRTTGGFADEMEIPADPTGLPHGKRTAAHTPRSSGRFADEEEKDGKK